MVGGTRDQCEVDFRGQPGLGSSDRLCGPQ